MNAERRFSPEHDLGIKMTDKRTEREKAANGIDLEKMRLEARKDALELEKRKKGLPPGKKKQIAGELKKITEELQAITTDELVEGRKKTTEDKPDWWGERRKMQKEGMAKKKARQVSDKEITERETGDNDASTKKGNETLPVVEKTIEHPPKKKKVLVLGEEAILAPDEELVNRELSLKVKDIEAVENQEFSEQEAEEERKKFAEFYKNYQKKNSQKPMVVQRHFTDEYSDSLEVRQEMDELAKQPSPELKQEFLEKNEEAMREGDEIALEKLRTENKELYNFSKKQSHLTEELDIKNIELKESLENAKKFESKLAAMEAEIGKQAEQLKNPTLKESIKKYLKDPKVAGIIVGGLIGAGIYTASGGAAPIYFALKTALGYKSLFIPAYLGHGFSTWGTLAAAGGLVGHFTEKLGVKLGLINGKKSDREKGQEALEKIKNAGSEQRPATETVTEVKSEKPQITQEKTEKEENNALSVEDAVKYFEENKAKSNDNLNLEDIKKMVEAILPKTTVNPVRLLVNKEKRKYNEIYNWLRNRRDEIEKAQPETETSEKDDELNFGEPVHKEIKRGRRPPDYTLEFPNEELEAKIARRLGFIDNFVKDFEAKKLTGQDLFTFSAQIAIWFKEARAVRNEATEDSILQKLLSSGLTNNNSKLQGEIINAMVEFAKKDEFYRKNKKEVLYLIGWLTFRNTKEEILKVKGISAETKNWL